MIWCFNLFPVVVSVKKLLCVSLQQMIFLSLVAGITKSNFVILSDSKIKLSGHDFLKST